MSQEAIPGENTQEDPDPRFLILGFLGIGVAFGMFSIQAKYSSMKLLFLPYVSGLAFCVGIGLFIWFRHQGEIESFLPS